MSDNIKELRITSEVFEDARNKFDGVLQKLFKTIINIIKNILLFRPHIIFFK